MAGPSVGGAYLVRVAIEDVGDAPRSRGDDAPPTVRPGPCEPVLRVLDRSRRDYRRKCTVSAATLSLPAQLEETRVPFRPRPVNDFVEAGLNHAQVEGLILKYLLSVGVASGRQVAEELGLPFGPFPE